MKRVAIVGGGFLGSALAASLPKPVTVTTRRTLDITAATPHEMRGALAGNSTLVIAVAPGRTQDRRTLYVDGTRRLLDARSDWERIIYIGSTSALPDRDAWLDESEIGMPTSERGRVQREAEAVVAATEIPWLVLRLGGLYGPTRPIGQIYRARGDTPLPGDGNVPTNLVHVDDAVQAIRAAIAAPPTLQGIVHVCDDDHTPRRTMYGDAVQWAETPTRVPHGKRVSNLRLKTALHVRLYHPTHRRRT